MMRVATLAALIPLVAGSLVATASSSTCPGYATVVNNTGYVNGEHLLKPPLPAATFGACCAACKAAAGCGALTYTKGGSCRLTAAKYAYSHGVAGARSASLAPMPPAPPPPAPPSPPSPPPSPPPFPDYCKGKKCKNVLYLLADDMRADWHTCVALLVVVVLVLLLLVLVLVVVLAVLVVLVLVLLVVAVLVVLVLTPAHRYGLGELKTPNLDKLAAKSLLYIRIPPAAAARCCSLENSSSTNPALVFILQHI